MKKSLLIVCGLGVGLFASAQNKTTQKNDANKPNHNISLIEENTANIQLVSPVAVRTTPLMITNAAVTSVPTGGSSNSVFTAYANFSRNLLDYNAALNTLTFTHRSCNAAACPTPDLSLNSGVYHFDVSKDGGATWAGQKGPIYKTFGGSYPGRYPQGWIINPSGNTNPDNAYLSYDGVSYTAVYNVPSGTTKISVADTACQADFMDATLNVGEPMSGCVANNVAWTIHSTYDTAVADYGDSILIGKGVFNTTTNCVGWTYTKLAFPVTVDATGYDHFGWTGTVAFGSTGQTGYIAVLGNADLAFQADTLYYVTVWKTTDGGATWGAASKLSVDANTQMGTSGKKYTTGFGLDGAVDKNNKLHLTFAVGDGGPLGAGSFYSKNGTWGMFAMMTDGTTGNTSLALLSKPQTWRGKFTGAASANTVYEDNRGQVAMNAAGDKAFYVWFDTDTTAYTPNPANGGANNTNPNMFVKMYDVNSSGWGPVVNVSGGSALDGGCMFGCVAAITGTGCANGYQIHCVVPTLGATSDVPVTWNYVNGACITSTGELANNSFNIGDAYPNPTTGSATLDVEVKQAGMMTVEVTNIIGQPIYSTSANLNVGTHQFNLEGSKWNSGVYFYTVKSKDFSVTKKLVVE